MAPLFAVFIRHLPYAMLRLPDAAYAFSPPFRFRCLLCRRCRFVTSFLRFRALIRRHSLLLHTPQTPLLLPPTRYDDAASPPLADVAFSRLLR